MIGRLLWSWHSGRLPEPWVQTRGRRPSPCVHIISAPKLLTVLTTWRRSGSDAVRDNAWTPRPALPEVLQLMVASPRFLPLTRFPGSPPAARAPRSSLWETPPGSELARARLLSESLRALSVSSRSAGRRAAGSVGALATWIQVTPPGAWPVSLSLSLSFKIYLLLAVLSLGCHSRAFL